MENPSNIVPDQLIVLEGDAGLVPKASSGDVGKVLGVLNSSGDVGWVPDQEGMSQVQSDWDQTDSSQVSYIANKPDLSVYATTSAMNTALAGKQDTISDLADIRSGAAKGDTAVQPAALNDYATTAAMNTALAGKQNTISDLDTIRAGAALGATAAQPSDLPSSDELLPSASSGDSGKVLTVDSNGDPEWITPSGGTTYSAGDGISIDDNNEIAVKTAGNGFTFDGTEYQNQYASDYKFSFTPGVRPVDRSQFVVNNSIYVTGHNNESVHLVIAKQYNETDYAVCNHSVQLSEDHLSSRTVFNLYGLDSRGYMSTSNPDWTFSSSEVQLNYGNVFVYITIAGSSGSQDTPNGEIPLKVCKTETYDETTYYSCSIVLQSAVGCLQIDQSLVLPAHSYLDNNKMLAVDGYGNAVWRAGIPSFSSTADNGKVLKVLGTELFWGTDGFTTTAGLTDIQVVNALPASPVATVLYMIPEA